jgi:hypothetical protein
MNIHNCKNHQYKKELCYCNECLIYANIKPIKKILDFDIERVLDLEIQESEPEININSCYSISFLSKNEQITLNFDYNTILNLINEIEVLKNNEIGGLNENA